MLNYSVFLYVIHTSAFLLWISTSATGLLPLKVAYTSILMAFFLVV
jgi:hypothetical protein